MAKVTYSSLKLKINEETKQIENSEIEVKQYLPTEDKISLINIVLQNSRENGIFNPILIDIYLHLYIAILYTNISFTDKQKEEPIKLYDCLKSNGLIDQIIINMNEDEYNYLYNALQQEISDINTYKNTVGGMISEIIENLPIKAEEMQKIVDNFDANKFKNVLDFAKAANGNRDIK